MAEKSEFYGLQQSFDGINNAIKVNYIPSSGVASIYS